MRFENPLYKPLLKYFMTDGLVNDLIQGKNLNLQEQYNYKPTRYKPILFEKDEDEYLEDCISDSDGILPMQMGHYKPLNLKKHASAKARIYEREISNYVVHLLAQVQSASPGIPELTLEVVLAALQVVCDDVYARFKFYYFADIEEARNDHYVEMIYKNGLSILASYRIGEQFHNQAFFMGTPALEAYYGNKYTKVYTEEGPRQYTGQLDTHVDFIRSIHFDNYKAYPVAIDLFAPGFYSDFNAQFFDKFANHRLKKLDACGVLIKDYEKRLRYFEPHGLKFGFEYE